MLTKKIEVEILEEKQKRKEWMKEAARAKSWESLTKNLTYQDKLDKKVAQLYLLGQADSQVNHYSQWIVHQP